MVLYSLRIVDFMVPALQIDGNDNNFDYKHEKIHSKTLNAFFSEQLFFKLCPIYLLQYTTILDEMYTKMILNYKPRQAYVAILQNK